MPMAARSRVRDDKRRHVTTSDDTSRYATVGDGVGDICGDKRR
ncbi:hypothetical protein BURPSPAST_T0320 [Burkholderia pseudomallei Pasteur 52237]|nr:hypothetical protein BURPSPAST_T0320 [Burkholderia pseudomallei Pasteur 52237]